MEDNKIEAELKRKGFKITKTRVSLLKLFGKNFPPFSQKEIRNKLIKSGLVLNKTTIYRELAFLANEGFVSESDFGDGKKRYESSFKGHHHHLICKECGDIGEVVVKGDLKSIENEIGKRKKFEIKSHILEFFGICGKCIKNN
jgi:Fur family transcriptional regulator, ferric uptake regulator